MSISCTVAPPKYAAKLLLKRWWKNLAHLSAWLYTIRVTTCLIAGEIFERIWPHHHGYWVLITLVIVVQRNFQTALLRTFQRTLGTLLGVVLAGLLFTGRPSIWIMIGIVVVLAALQAFLKEVNYVAYATIMTPLVIILLDFGKEFSISAVVDRLVATLYAGVLALILGYLLWSKLFSRSARTRK